MYRFVLPLLLPGIIAGCAHYGEPTRLANGTVVYPEGPLTLNVRASMLGGASGLAGWQLAFDGSRAIASNNLVPRSAYPLLLEVQDVPQDWLYRYRRLDLVFAREKSRFGVVEDQSLSICGKELPLEPVNARSDMPSRRYWPDAPEQVTLKIDLEDLRKTHAANCEPAILYQVMMTPEERKVEARLSSMKVILVP